MVAIAWRTTPFPCGQPTTPQRQCVSRLSGTLSISSVLCLQPTLVNSSAIRCVLPVLEADLAAVYYGHSAGTLWCIMPRSAPTASPPSFPAPSATLPLPLHRLPHQPAEACCHICSHTRPGDCCTGDRALLPISTLVKNRSVRVAHRRWRWSEGAADCRARERRISNGTR